MRLVLDASVAVKWYAPEDGTREALELATLTGGSFYDALYVALSERQNLRVVTADSRMIKAFDRTGRCVHVEDFKF